MDSNGTLLLWDPANNIYGFTEHWAQVWFDTFHVDLLSSDTNSMGNVAVSVNVTVCCFPKKA